MDVKLKELPAIPILFARYTGPFEECYKAWETLMPWAGQRDLFCGPFDTLGISQDDPKHTPPLLCRYDAALVISKGLPPSVQAAPPVQLGETAPGLYACWYSPAYHHEDFAKAFTELFSWIEANGYICVGAPYEYYPNTHLRDPDLSKPWVVEFRVPVQKK